METRWLSVIKSEDSFSANQITALWRDVLNVGYTHDLIAVCISFCLSLSKPAVSSFTMNHRFIISVCIFHSSSDAHHNRAAIVQMEKGWTVWGRVGRMTSYWDNWLMLVTMAEGEGQITLRVRERVQVQTYIRAERVNNRFIDADKQ